MKLEDARFLEETVPYAEFADRLVKTCFVNDPWYGGVPIFRSAPVILSRDFIDGLYEVARRIGALYQEMVEIVLKEPELLDSFFALPPHYKLMWLASDGLWHGFSRFDSFLTEDGKLAVCELNADTPSGQMEAIIPNLVVRDAFPDCEDPNAGYADALFRVFQQFYKSVSDEAPKTAGIIYPTDLPEDSTLILLYKKWLEERGLEVFLGSPHNVSLRPDGGLSLLGNPVDVVLRHYKTDWWGERPRIFADEDEVPNPEPLKRELYTVLEAERNGKVAVVNPFGAILPQDKLALAFFWEEKGRFSAKSQETIEAHIPETRRLDQVRDQMRTEREGWVLKSDFGCEGDEVIIGPNVDEETWQAALDLALPGIWVTQRFFRVRPITLSDDAGQAQYLPNWGVFLVGGEPGGLLVRIAYDNVTTGEDARVVPVLVESNAKSG